MVAAGMVFVGVVIYAIYKLIPESSVSPAYGLKANIMAESYWVCVNAKNAGSFNGLAAALVVFRKDVIAAAKWCEDNKEALEGEETYEEFVRLVNLRMIQIGIFESDLDAMGLVGFINCTSNTTFFYVDMDGTPAGFAYNTKMIQLKGVPVGSHTVKIHKHGYIPECTESVNVTEGTVKTVDCQMTETGACSSVTAVSIYIDPLSPIKDQTVSFNGSAKSGDPITSWEWDFGDDSTATGQAVTHKYRSTKIYTIRLTVTNECDESAFSERMVTVTAEPDEESGTLLVARPIDAATNKECIRAYDAEIYVDNRAIGKTTQFSIPFGTNKMIGGWGGQCGDHDISVILSGYTDAKKEVTIDDGDTKSWQPIMTATSAAVGSIKCTSNQAGFAVYVDGAYIDHSYDNTYLVVPNIEVGSHKVKIEKGLGYTPTHCEETITVVAGGTVTVDCQMVKDEPPTESTSLSIGCPIDAYGNEWDRCWDFEIWVDGKITNCDPPHTLVFGTGAYCDCRAPYNLIECRLGTHTITVKKHGFDDVSKTITLEKDAPQSWTPEMYPEGTTPPPRHIISFVVPVGSTAYIDDEPLTGTTTVGRLTTIFNELRKR
jgi:PKD repeat protein